MNHWEETERNETHIKYRSRNEADTAWGFAVRRIDSGPPPMGKPGNRSNEIELGQRGYRARIADGPWVMSSDAPFVPRTVGKENDGGCGPGQED